MEKFKLIRCYPGSPKQCDLSNKLIKRFSTKEKAEEYILMNKPCLSLSEISDVLHCTIAIGYSNTLQELKNLLKTKMS